MQSSAFVEVPLEGTLFFLIVTENASEVPTNPDAAPTFEIRNAGGVVISGTAVNVETGVYSISGATTAANGFAAGQVYAIKVAYAMSAANRRQTHHMIVV